MRCAIFIALCYVALRVLFLHDVRPSFISTGISTGVAWLFIVGFLAMPRLIIRVLYESKHRAAGAAVDPNREVEPILLVGDFRRIDIFLRELVHDSPPAYRVVGILTHDVSLHGGHIRGVEVFGDAENLGKVVSALTERGCRPRRIVLAQDNMDEATTTSLVEAASRMNLATGRLSRRGSLEEGDGKPPNAVRPIALADLLGRREISYDCSDVKTLVAGKRVLITGAGGSIGSELSRQIAALGPSELTLVDSSEYNIYSIDLELAESYPSVTRIPRIVDVRDTKMITDCIAEACPHILFHAAALKHVPLLERNPIQAVTTNVMGTANVADACTSSGVGMMVMVSTDKAVNPLNVMGATKRLAEAYCQALDCFAPSGQMTRFVTVRFGNVLGSSGSVVPMFQRQLARGGPLTVTHPDVTRFFMTIPEAVALILQAGAQGMTAKRIRGSIYVLDMGKPVNITALARRIIQLAGKRPDIDVKIEFVGLRPGEKLYEEVVHKNELPAVTSTAGIFEVTPRSTDLTIIRLQLQELEEACRLNDVDRLLQLLQITVPEYKPEHDSLPLLTRSARSVDFATMDEDPVEPKKRVSAA